MQRKVRKKCFEFAGAQVKKNVCVHPESRWSSLAVSSLATSFSVSPLDKLVDHKGKPIVIQQLVPGLISGCFWWLLGSGGQLISLGVVFLSVQWQLLQGAKDGSKLQLPGLYQQKIKHLNPSPAPVSEWSKSTEHPVREICLESCSAKSFTTAVVQRLKSTLNSTAPSCSFARSPGNWRQGEGNQVDDLNTVMGNRALSSWRDRRDRNP